MTRPSRLLLAAADPPATTTAAPAPDSDYVVILASLLCALICLLGLISVARCAWLRRRSSVSGPPPPPSAANKGLKKKALTSLPTQTFSPDSDMKFGDCAICLSEFTAGDEIRVLPLCGHGFHVNCVDTWLGSHSSCPSCRQILVVARCQKCGGVRGEEGRGETESGVKEREGGGGGGNMFLP